MKTWLMIFALIGSMAMHAVAEAVISRMNASQRPGTKLVDITFDVTSPSANEVAVSVRIQRPSTVWGSTNYYAVASPAVTGDVGAGISTGSGKTIVWDMEEDWDGKISTILFTVTANDMDRRPSGGDPNALSWEVVNNRWVRNSYQNGQVTMTDLSSNNMWLYDAASTSKMNPYDGASHCDYLYYAGYRDWELPGTAHLTDLYSQKQFFEDVRDAWYCASNRAAYTTWYVDMNDGSVWPNMNGLFGPIPEGYIWPRRTCQIVSPLDVASDSCEIDSRTRTLTVISEHGTAFPAVGTHSNYCWESRVPCSVDPWVREGGTNFTCTGFSQTTGMNGNSGTLNYTTLYLWRYIHNTITWRWAVTGYHVDVAIEGEGQVNAESGWYSAGTNLSLSAVPSDGWFFTGWSGDLSGNHTASNAVLTVDNVKQITAHFTNDRDGNGLPDMWELQYAVHEPAADNDGDGYDNLSEYVAGTDPTNAASFFRTWGWHPAFGDFAVSWEPCVSNRLYDVYRTHNLGSEFQLWASGIEYPQNSCRDWLNSGESAGFYRVEVRMR
jgi:hypothetical protein